MNENLKTVINEELQSRITTLLNIIATFKLCNSQSDIVVALKTMLKEPNKVPIKVIKKASKNMSSLAIKFYSKHNSAAKSCIANALGHICEYFVTENVDYIIKAESYIIKAQDYTQKAEQINSSFS